MIHYLKITNFGPIKDEVELSFEVAEQMDVDAYELQMPDGRKLLKLAYIYGANASGKTTILKAFEFLRKLLLKPITDKSIELDFDPFLFRDDAQQQPSRFELSFYVESIRYVYDVTFTKQAILDEKIVFYQTAKPTELFSRSTDMEKRLAKIQFGSKIKVPVREKDLLESNTLHNNSVVGAYAKTNVDIPELEKLNIWLKRYLVELVTWSTNLTEITASLIQTDPNANAWINQFLNKADKQIIKVNVEDSESKMARFYNTVKSELETWGFNDTPGYENSHLRKIELVHNLFGDKSYSLPFFNESNGTKRYFGLGGVLYALIHGSFLMCVDELDTSLHPDLMKYFLQVFLVNAKNSQLLVTTHNISLMENQDFIRRDALWFSEKIDDGSINLYSAADFDSTTLRKDASLINAYKSGRLGAKPNLGSPYLNEE